MPSLWLRAPIGIETLRGAREISARNACIAPARRIHPLMLLDAPAPRGGLHLSAGGRLTLAALGVVYGDIGTSPLYAVRQSLVDFGDMSERAILGALSLIV